MKISEADKAMGAKYREIKGRYGGKKTVPKGKYGFKSIRFLVKDTTGREFGPFLGRGSALTCYQNEINKKGQSTVGVSFLVQEIFKPKDPTRKVVIDAEHVFTISGKGKGRGKQ